MVVFKDKNDSVVSSPIARWEPKSESARVSTMVHRYTHRSHGSASAIAVGQSTRPAECARFPATSPAGPFCAIWWIPSSLE